MLKNLESVLGWIGLSTCVAAGVTCGDGLKPSGAYFDLFQSADGSDETATFAECGTLDCGTFFDCATFADCGTQFDCSTFDCATVTCGTETSTLDCATTTTTPPSTDESTTTTTTTTSTDPGSTM